MTPEQIEHRAVATLGQAENLLEKALDVIDMQRENLAQLEFELANTQNAELRQKLEAICIRDMKCRNKGAPPTEPQMLASILNAYNRRDELLYLLALRVINREDLARTLDGIDTSLSITRALGMTNAPRFLLGARFAISSILARLDRPILDEVPTPEIKEEHAQA